MNQLADTFRDRSAFAPSGPYRLLPARFSRLDDRRYVITNDVGEYVVLERPALQALLRHELQPGTPLYADLKSRHFLFDGESRVALDLLALKYRSRADRIADFTALHMFVVTLRCDHTCSYCQVSRQMEEKSRFDMSQAHADRAVEFVFRSPSPAIKIEFQGGEPLLNFDLIRHVVLRAESLNREHGRDLVFVIASNLTRLNDEILDFCKGHRIYFSTSLDGPADLHDERRALPRGSSYRAAVDGIQRIREALGPDAVAALMTTSPGSLPRVREIVDEYVKQGFHSIFLRSLSPYGFAVRTSLVRRYDVDDWVKFYVEGLRHIIDLNLSGYPMREEFAAILLQKMFAPVGNGYVDLQSPAGLGIAGIIYNYDGAIYASDEGRMLAEMGDHTFRLGHLDEDSFEEVMTSDTLVDLLKDSMLEGLPMCSDCAFMPYCGSDPVFHKATQGDVIGHKAFSSFCKKQMAVLRHLIALMEDDASARRVLQSWI
ncbi:His-Xaa-Ser system radical SAM maturase HxsB [Nannocystis bainbridge]|uniref:His-Xaa-Ser system radical SAM maturase HxsB n=1 Tax=Nannocystis bainbridge TaxID=2995303 RepID=A0ABT5E6M3_9BACT|nr:His-Xaa-Ser system radical SAM maturase HxsB [Nannocystis bainbridge]MDC0721506.1 His-Xaa-Ser system radical SAM maturase HxsB [Nannocystis bainbridge]